jgi:hypothetical protein
MKVICISGKAQHGKDTFAKMLEEELLKKEKTVLIAHFADLVKYICKTIFGWDGEKDDKGRAILQYVGTDVVRKKNPNYWVKFIIDILTMFNTDWDYILIPDCRFPNEYELFKTSGLDASLIRVNRPNFESKLPKEQKEHISETALDNYPYDYLIDEDNTLEYLHKKANELSELFCKEENLIEKVTDAV